MGTTVGQWARTARRQCWSADSLDGMWAYQRAEDEGTRWYLIHIPTGWTLIGGHGTLRAARADTATGDAFLDLWLDAHWTLTQPAYGIGDVDSHDRARAVLTWLADDEPRLVQVAAHRTESRRLRESAARCRAVSDDLGRRFDETMRANPEDIGNKLLAGRLWALRAECDSRATDLHIRAANLAEAAQMLRRADLADRAAALRGR